MIPVGLALQPEEAFLDLLGDVILRDADYYEVAPENMKAFLDRAGHAMAIVPVQVERAHPIRPALLLLQASAVFVLLVGGLAGVLHGPLSTAFLGNPGVARGAPQFGDVRRLRQLPHQRVLAPA